MELQNKQENKEIIIARKPMLLNWLSKPEESSVIAKRIDSIICITVEDAIKASSCCLAEIAIFDKDSAVRILTILIGEAVLYFNVGKTMGPAQIKITIDMLLADPILKNLKPEDYKVFFEDMKKGYYGNLYDRFDGQIIFQNAVKYADKRAGIIETDSINRANELKTKGNASINPEMIPYLKQAINEIPKENKTKEFSKELIKPKPIQKDEHTILIQSFLNDFEQEFKKHPINQAGKRYIKYNGVIVDQIEYAEKRLNEK